MKIRKSKNKKSKLHIKFDEADRRDYLLGFRKRKLERKERAKLQMEEKMKKEKREMKKKRIELIKKMIDGREASFGDDSDEDDVEEEEDTPAYQNDKAVTEYDNCTVEVSDLNLDSKFFLGTNKSDLKNHHPPPSSSQRYSEEQEAPSFRVPLDKVKKSKIKTSIWKSASKKAKKSLDFEKRIKKRKKKKVLVTEL